MVDAHAPFAMEAARRGLVLGWQSVSGTVCLLLQSAFAVNAEELLLSLLQVFSSIKGNHCLKGQDEKWRGGNTEQRKANTSKKII